MWFVVGQLIPEIELNGNIGLESVEVGLRQFFNEGIQLMGAVVGVAVGGWFVFKIIRKGLAWAGRGL